MKALLMSVLALSFMVSSVSMAKGSGKDCNKRAGGLLSLRENTLTIKEKQRQTPQAKQVRTRAAG